MKVIGLWYIIVFKNRTEPLLNVIFHLNYFRNDVRSLRSVRSSLMNNLTTDYIIFIMFDITNLGLSLNEESLNKLLVVSTIFEITFEDEGESFGLVTLYFMTVPIRDVLVDICRSWRMRLHVGYPQYSLYIRGFIKILLYVIK